MDRHRRALLIGLAGVLGASRAHALDAPRGPVVLTITGRVARTNDGARALFDMGMIESMPQESFTTKTPWYAQPRKFTGPLLRDVLAAVGAQGTTVRALALNDYRVDIPFEDAQQHDMLLARLLDDKPMPVRDKGPLFIIYPFDSKPELKNAVYYSRAAWQLKALEIL